MKLIKINVQVNAVNVKLHTPSTVRNYDANPSKVHGYQAHPILYSLTCKYLCPSRPTKKTLPPPAPLGGLSLLKSRFFATSTPGVCTPPTNLCTEKNTASFSKTLLSRPGTYFERVNDVKTRRYSPYRPVVSQS